MRTNRRAANNHVATASLRARARAAGARMRDASTVGTGMRAASTVGTRRRAAIRPGAIRLTAGIHPLVREELLRRHRQPFGG
ncbi:hypothetical protein A5696_07255 [Mycobacterium sp. E2699]|nr:hypothetical protein A5696_07255 [Mycobacterium sp. E2699]